MWKQKKLGPELRMSESAMQAMDMVPTLICKAHHSVHGILATVTWMVMVFCVWLVNLPVTGLARLMTILPILWSSLRIQGCLHFIPINMGTNVLPDTQCAAFKTFNLSSL